MNETTKHKGIKVNLTKYQWEMLTLIKRKPHDPVILNQSTLGSLFYWKFVRKIESEGRDYITLTERGLQFMEDYHDLENCLRSNTALPVAPSINKWMRRVTIFQKKKENEHAA